MEAALGDDELTEEGTLTTGAGVASGTGLLDIASAGAGAGPAASVTVVGTIGTIRGDDSITVAV